VTGALPEGQANDAGDHCGGGGEPAPDVSFRQQLRSINAATSMLISRAGAT